MIIGGCPRMAIFPPANRGIYASLRQAQIVILEILNVWMPVPLYLSGVVIIFAFLDLGKNMSFSDSFLKRYHFTLYILALQATA
jgi:hypothetical protein